jgi:hypothetical protein
MKAEEEQAKPHALSKMGLTVNFDTGVVTGFTGITARINEVNANSVFFQRHDHQSSGNRMVRQWHHRPDHRLAWCDRDVVQSQN